LKYSGRVGRTAAAKILDENAVFLAVAAHIRHTETNYDELLMQGTDRSDARRAVSSAIAKILETWSSSGESRAGKQDA
jgi:hypothetical protein